MTNALSQEEIDVTPEGHLDFINQTFSSRDDILKKGFTFSKETGAKLEDLIKQVSLDNEAAGVGLFFKQAKALQVNIEEIMRDYEKFKSHYTEKIPQIEDLVTKLSVYTTEIEKREKEIKFIENMELLEELSSYVQAALVINEYDLAASSFAKLSVYAEELLSGNDEKAAENAKERILQFYNLLKERATSKFQESLKLLDWPFISTSKSKPLEQAMMSAEEKMANFETNFCHLVQLKLPDELVKKEEAKSSLFRDWKPLLPPMVIMLEPLRKRFRFHFSGDRKTNRLDKPEWYMTQVIQWIKDHESFLTDTVQKCMERVNMAHIDIKVEFIRGLVALVLEKMQEDLARMAVIHSDDEMFSHLVDEALTMDAELKTGLGYPDELPCPSDVLTNEAWFQRWLAVEKKFATEKLDELFLSPSAWEPITATIKRPECCDAFLGLLLAMTGRARRLRTLTRRAQFHRLQLGLIDDFRLRLAQVTKTTSPTERRWADVLNALFAVRETLAEWANDMFYVEFWEDESARYLSLMSMSMEDDSKEEQQGAGDESTSFSGRHEGVKRMLTESLNLGSGLDESTLSSVWGSRGQIGAGEQQSVFESALRLYEHMSREMLGAMVQCAYDDLASRGRSYRRDRWLSMPGPLAGGGGSDANMALSPSACEMFLVLRDRLHCLQEWLVDPLFTRAWQAVSARMNTFIFQRVILKNRFNDGGAAQLRFDLSKNLIPLFALYTRRPEVYFRESREACLLLTLPAGSVLLLKDVLRRGLHPGESSSGAASLQPADPAASLGELGVSRLSPDEAELVLSLKVTSDKTM